MLDVVMWLARSAAAANGNKGIVWAEKHIPSTRPIPRYVKRAQRRELCELKARALVSGACKLKAVIVY